MEIRYTRSCLEYEKISKFTQETQEKNCTKENSYTMDDFAEELLKCIDGMPVYQVSRSFIENCIFLYKCYISECMYANAN